MHRKISVEPCSAALGYADSRDLDVIHKWDASDCCRFASRGGERGFEGYRTGGLEVVEGQMARREPVSRIQQH